MNKELFILLALLKAPTKYYFKQSSLRLNASIYFPVIFIIIMIKTAKAFGWAGKSSKLGMRKRFIENSFSLVKTYKSQFITQPNDKEYENNL